MSARALAYALIAALAAACASRAAPVGYASIDAKKDDIRELWMQIRDWRVKELGIRAEPPPPDAVLVAKPVDSLRQCDAAPAPETAEACTDTCTLRDAICDNADAICRIAEDLGDDVWADDKCKSAKSSCREATERCCGCRGG